MLQFSKDFFKGEYRDNFYIDETMKSAWAAQLEVLQKIIDICEKYQLKYYVFWGTLLGAVRHKGYIPWDDDLDIALDRKDYSKLLEVAKQELPEGYCVLNLHTEPEWGNFHSRITNSHVIDISEGHMREYHGCPFVVGVDIYPVDYIPRDREQRDTLKTLLNLVANIQTFVEDKEVQQMAGRSGADYEEAIEEGLSTLEGYFEIQFDRRKNLVNQLNCLYDNICIAFSEEESEYMTVFPVYMLSKERFVLLKDWLADTIPMPFENIVVQVPVGYEESLWKRFGAGYMTPLREEAGHDYPFYKDQQQMLEERGLWEKAKSLAQYLTEQGKDAEAGNAPLPDGKDAEAENAPLSDGKDAGKKKPPLPEAWEKYVLRPDGSRKNIMLYRVSTVTLASDGKRVIRKMRRTLKTFRDHKDDIAVLWKSEDMLESTLKAFEPKILREYQNLVRNYCEEDWGIYDTGMEIEEIVNICSAYYGDYNSVVKRFQEQGKPAMIQNVEVV